jgi:hypothetical protein
MDKATQLIQLPNKNSLMDFKVDMGGQEEVNVSTQVVWVFSTCGVLRRIRITY